MERKYTKGPWEIEDEYVQQVGQAKLRICSIMNVDERGKKGLYRGDVTVANAELIAAAPCLLEALEKAMTVLTDSVGDFDYEQACDAIARATEVEIDTHEATILKAHRLSAYECGKFAHFNGFGLSDAWMLLAVYDKKSLEDFHQGMQDQQERRYE